MKTKGRAIRILVLVFVLLFSLKPLQAKTYPWKIVHPVFDSLAALLDTAANPDQEEQEAILKQLETISLSQNNAVLNIRYRFWNAYLNGDNWNTTQNENAKNNYLLETLSYIDSMNYDYDYARILFLILNSPNNSSDYLSQYQQEI